MLAHFETRRGRELVEPDGLRRPPFRLVRSLRDGHDDVPVVPEQLIVRLEGPDALDRVRARLADAGYRVGDATQVGGFADLWQLPVVVDLGHAARPSSDLRVIARIAGAVDGVAGASLRHVGALAGRAKGGCTPEPTDVDVPPCPQDAQVAVDPLVVVVDTGLDVAATPEAAPDERRTDRWLDGITMGAGAHIDLLDTVGYEGDLGGDGYLDLAAGHGTFVAGIVRQRAPGANIVMLRALDTDGFGDESTLVAAIAAADELFTTHFDTHPGGRGILNLSLGFETFDGEPPVGIERAIAQLHENVAVVAAAGNGATGTPMWPAALADERVLGVAAVYDPTGDAEAASLQPCDWSNHGDWVDFSALGEGVISTFVEGTETPSRTAEDPYDDHPDQFAGPDAYALWTGTSFATAKVSGALAEAMADNPGFTVAEAVAHVGGQGATIPGHPDFGVALPY